MGAVTATWNIVPDPAEARRVPTALLFFVALSGAVLGWRYHCPVAATSSLVSRPWWVLVLALGCAGVVSCGHETFDLLAPEQQDATGGERATGGTGAGGRGGSETGGVPSSGGTAGSAVWVPPSGGEAGWAGWDHPDPNFCIQCKPNEVCDFYNQQCIPAEGLPCRNCEPDQVCNPYTMQCADRCEDERDCFGRRRICDPRLGLCVECIHDYDCQVEPGAPLEECYFGKCASCTNNDHCAPPTDFCHPLELQCVECLGDNHCEEPTRPHCLDQEHRCVACIRNDECGLDQRCEGNQCTAIGP